MSDGEEGVGEESEDEHELERGMEGTVEEEVGRSGAGGPLITISWVEYNLDYNRENMDSFFDGVTVVDTASFFSTPNPFLKHVNSTQQRGFSTHGVHQGEVLSIEKFHCNGIFLSS